MKDFQPKTKRHNADLVKVARTLQIIFKVLKGMVQAGTTSLASVGTVTGGKFLLAVMKFARSVDDTVNLSVTLNFTAS